MKPTNVTFRTISLLGSIIALIALTAIITRGNDITIIGPGEYKAPPQGQTEPTPTPAPVDTSANISTPIGSVVAWIKSKQNTPSLSAEWVECNGQKLNMPNSPYHGIIVPNLNGANDQPKRFLRGSTQSGAIGGSSSHNHGLILSSREGKRVVNVQAGNHAGNLPDFYEITWIMRVK